MTTLNAVFPDFALGWARNGEAEHAGSAGLQMRKDLVMVFLGSRLTVASNG
jgi:hypothetical protein